MRKQKMCREYTKPQYTIFYVETVNKGKPRATEIHYEIGVQNRLQHSFVQSVSAMLGSWRVVSHSYGAAHTLVCVSLCYSVQQELYLTLRSCSVLQQPYVFPSCIYTYTQYGRFTNIAIIIVIINLLTNRFPCRFPSRPDQLTLMLAIQSILSQNWISYNTVDSSCRLFMSTSTVGTCSARLVGSSHRRDTFLTRYLFCSLVACTFGCLSLF